MAPLTSEQIRRENQNLESNSITSLRLNARALSDVSCLRDFANLERLDLGCNNLSSLEGLGSCTNLKWLSVAQNKLDSLNGIEGLSKLTVLNAGQNLLRSINEVRSLTSLRALILNDNNISYICKLDPLKYLNTLVLSRNPIYDIGKSLENMKSITKLSLSNCQIQEIGSSFVSCVELKEARFAHNEITTLPNHLAQNAKLQLLDLGKNAISMWSDLKVLSELHNLRNLNLQGNPIAEKDKLAKKVKKLVLNLQIFNAKPIEKGSRSRKITEEGSSFPSNDDDSPKGVVDLESAKGMKRKRSKSDVKEYSKQKKSNSSEGDGALSWEVADEILKKKHKNSDKITQKILSSALQDDNSPFNSVDTKARNEVVPQKPKKLEGNRASEFDDGESSFMDLILSDTVSKDADRQNDSEDRLLSGLVINPAKNKKKKKARGTDTGSAALKLLPPVSEVGMGGPSAWDD